MTMAPLVTSSLPIHTLGTRYQIPYTTEGDLRLFWNEVNGIRSTEEDPAAMSAQLERGEGVELFY